jgi:hypothetical protein
LEEEEEEEEDASEEGGADADADAAVVPVFAGDVNLSQCFLCCKTSFKRASARTYSEKRTNPKLLSIVGKP